ncbi:MAG: glycosyltransferase 87 family protein [Candidatus Dormibacteraceae bacterium]
MSPGGPSAGRRLARLGLVAGTLAGAEAALFYLFNWARFLTGSLRGPDFFSFYAAARLYLARGGPHVYELTAQKHFQDLVTAAWPGRYVLLPYVHPPYYTFLIAPLGWLPYRSAYLLAGLVNVALLAAVVALLVRGSNLKRVPAAAAAALAVGFYPAFVTLLQGQSDFVMMLPLAGAYLAWGRGRQGTAGSLAGLAMVKPQLLLLLPVLFIARRAWRALVAFVAVVAVLAAGSLAAFGTSGVLDYLGVIGPWAVGRRSASPISNQTIFSLRGVLDQMPGGHLPALIVLAALLTLVGLSLLWRPDLPRLDMALAVSASLALSPYQNLHDLSLLLVPGFALATLLSSGRLRWPAAGASILVLGWISIGLVPIAGAIPATATVLLLAAYLAAERLAVRPEAIPFKGLGRAGPRPRRVIVLPAYRAARTLHEVVGEIPAGHADRILLVDDASADATVSVATALRLDVIRHPRNLGYGGNQKTCYSHALAMGADVVVMLHPDGQYDPRVIPDLCGVIESGAADVALGSRWLGLDPARAGMPAWKRAGNRFLTRVENRVLGLGLSEYHTGYRAYSRRFLATIPFLENSDDFVFDTQILVQAAAFGFRIAEVPAVGRYFEGMSTVGFRASAVYGCATLFALARYVLHRAGFTCRWLRVPVATEPEPTRAAVRFLEP